ncbi:hypothetical protein SVIOM74S_01122 [Streptomyces violarus]
MGLAATVGGEFIATVRYDRIGADGTPASAPADEAEVAFLVQDAHQGRGVASALLEHIGAIARERGIRRFAAEVLPANTKMIKVFTDAGYTQKRSFEDGVVRLEFDLEPTDRSLAVQYAREHRAGPSLVRSIRTAPLLFGWRGSAPADTGALEELLLRVSRLVDDHPEVVAVTLEPVVVASHGLSVLGASIRLAPPPARDDLGPRTLPAY